jgi:hypothetical protein
MYLHKQAHQNTSTSIANDTWTSTRTKRQEETPTDVREVEHKRPPTFLSLFLAYIHFLVAFFWLLLLSPAHPPCDEGVTILTGVVTPFFVLFPSPFSGIFRHLQILNNNTAFFLLLLVCFSFVI